MSGHRGWRFCEGPWENSKLPSITCDNPTGGDPYVLCQISRIYDPDALYELCSLANGVDALASAAQAVIDRWETPLWKDAEPTGAVIYRLRDALARVRSKD